MNYYVNGGTYVASVQLIFDGIHVAKLVFTERNRPSLDLRVFMTREVSAPIRQSCVADLQWYKQCRGRPHHRRDWQTCGATKAVPVKSWRHVVAYHSLDTHIPEKQSLQLYILFSQLVDSFAVHATRMTGISCYSSMVFP
jgi:hypothetical protein